MNQNLTFEKTLEVAKKFQIEEEIKNISSYGSGHINDTLLVECEKKDGSQKRYIMQRMNTEIFTNPDQLMENILNVTSFLRKKIVENGGDPERETLNVIPVKDGKSFYRAEDGSCWRVYSFVEGATCYDQVEKPDDFYQSAVAFGNFQRLLADFSAEKLYETIEKFHDTPDRFAKLKAAVEADVCGRAAEVQEEIAFAFAREKDTHCLIDLLKEGKLPLRVTHNDTKLNNIMIDNETGKGICVIDLDTVMPGLALHDFGDSIRFGASTAAEDEKDLSKVSCDMNLFALYTRGFIEGCAGSLTNLEIEMLPMGAKLMTLECGMRFLTDYLQNDVYFKVHYDGQNLDRCRTQFKLVADMESKWEQMMEIVRAYQKG